MATVSVMPPKNALRGKGKAPARKSVRTTRPPARLVEPPSSTDEDEPLLLTTHGPSSTHVILQQLAATNRRLDTLARRFEQEDDPATKGSRCAQDSAPLPQASGPRESDVSPASVTLPLPTDMADSPQALMGKAIEHMLDGSGTSKGESALASYMTLGFTLELRVKAKIWGKQFVELSTLVTVPEKSLAVTFDSSDNPMIALSTGKPKGITNIFQWLRLFGTYAAVYLERYPTEAPGVMTYIVHVLDLQKKVPRHRLVRL